MKKLLILTALTFCLQAVSHSQTNSEPLTLKNNFFGWQFRHRGEKLSLAEASDLMSVNEQATAYMRSARSNYTMAQIVSGVGGFMVGYPVGTSMGGGKPNWALAGVGAGLIAVSVPFSIKANKQAKNAVAAYNEAATTTTSRKPVFRLGFSGNGLGMNLHF
jgi:hypothetical protein